MIKNNIIHWDEYPNNFDFIRFCLASFVVLSHSYQIVGKRILEPFGVFTNHFAGIGEFAVYLFFIISGFLITKSFLNNSVRNYLKSRFLRIYPALFVLIIITILTGSFISSDTFFEYYLSETTFNYLLNIFCLKLNFELPGLFNNNPIGIVNGSIWSLPYEIFCYLFLGVLGLFLDKKINYYFVLLLVFALIFFFSIGINNYKLILIYLAYFFSGSIFFLFQNRIAKNILIFIVLFISSLLILNSEFLSLLSKKILLIFTLPYIIFYLAFQKSYLNSFGKYGDFSYGIYIYGFFIQQIVFTYFPTSNQFLNFLISYPIILFIGYSSYHLIEKQFMKTKTQAVK